MSIARPKAKVHTLDAYDNAEAFLAAAKKLAFNPKETVFAFPSNARTPSTKVSVFQRYTEKKDVQDGVRNTANILSDVGTPTMFLPLDEVAQAQEIQASKDALRKLWLALGYGMDLAIPAQGKETPWTATSPANPVLTALYLQGFSNLQAFAQSDKEDPALLADADGNLLIDADFVGAYNHGWMMKADPANANISPQALAVLAPNPAVPLHSLDFKKRLEDQENARFWKTVAAWTVSIISGGLLAIPAYLLWRSAKANEDIQEVSMKPVEYAAMDQFRKMIMNSTAEARTSTPIQDRPNKPKKLKPEASVDADTEQSYLMDKFAKARHDLVSSMFQHKRKDITKEELNRLEELTKESVSLAPALK